jgi:TetR/AcrR family transcriptional regulator, transcriptional repressor for nem operon
VRSFSIAIQAADEAYSSESMRDFQTIHPSKANLLDAALRLIRSKGYSAMTVDELCIVAGVTKGSFFYHFESKEHLAVEAAAHFANIAEQLFAGAPFARAADPLDRLLGYVDFRSSILSDDLADCTCLFGTMIQEAYSTHPAIRSACDGHLRDHVDQLSKDIAEAQRLYAPDADWSDKSLARFTQAVIQGAFVLAKAANSSEVASESLGHLRRYIGMLFS